MFKRFIISVLGLLLLTAPIAASAQTTTTSVGIFATITAWAQLFEQKVLQLIGVHDQTSVQAAPATDTSAPIESHTESKNSVTTVQPHATNSTQSSEAHSVQTSSTNVVQPSATIDPSSLTPQANGALLIKGTAAGVKKIDLGVYLNGVNVSGVVTGPHLVSNGTWSVPVNALPAGTYTINVTNGDVSARDELATVQITLKAATAAPVTLNDSTKAAIITDIDHLRSVYTSGSAAEVRQLLSIKYSKNPQALAYVPTLSDANILDEGHQLGSNLPSDAQLKASGVLVWSLTSSTHLVISLSSDPSTQWTFDFIGGHWY